MYEAHTWYRLNSLMGANKVYPKNVHPDIFRLAPLIPLLLIVYSCTMVAFCSSLHNVLATVGFGLYCVAVDGKWAQRFL